MLMMLIKVPVMMLLVHVYVQVGARLEKLIERGVRNIRPVNIKRFELFDRGQRPQRAIRDRHIDQMQPPQAGKLSEGGNPVISHVWAGEAKLDQLRELSQIVKSRVG